MSTPPPQKFCMKCNNQVTQIHPTKNVCFKFHYVYSLSSRKIQPALALLKLMGFVETCAEMMSPDMRRSTSSSNSISVSSVRTRWYTCVNKLRCKRVV